MEKVVRTYSRETRRALEFLASQISAARRERRFSEQELADRVGISRSTLRAIEAGNPKVQIGVVLETASLLGVPLFSEEGVPQAALTQAKEKLALLPKRIRKKEVPVDDDF